MTLKQYQYLDEVAQEIVLWEQGVLVAERSWNGIIFQLYQVGSFYIELKYNVALNLIEGITSFEFSHKLDIYLESITLPLDE